MKTLKQAISIKKLDAQHVHQMSKLEGYMLLYQKKKIPRCNMIMITHIDFIPTFSSMLQLRLISYSYVDKHTLLYLLALHNVRRKVTERGMYGRIHNKATQRNG